MSGQQTQSTGPSDGGAWTGFLIMSFAVVGLMGGMGIYAAQLPFERALARAATLDQVLAVAGAPDAATKLEALRPALGDSAAPVLTGAVSDLPARVAAERVRMLAAFGAEARDGGFRLRFVLAVFTVAGAVFGAAILGIARRSRPSMR